MTARELLEMYVRALGNPFKFVQDAQGVADKQQERNRATEEAIKKMRQVSGDY
jgi:hypothetical protein